MSFPLLTIHSYRLTRPHAVESGLRTFPGLLERKDSDAAAYLRATTGTAEQELEPASTQVLRDGVDRYPGDEALTVALGDRSELFRLRAIRAEKSENSTRPFLTVNNTSRTSPIRRPSSGTNWPISTPQQAGWRRRHARCARRRRPLRDRTRPLHDGAIAPHNQVGKYSLHGPSPTPSFEA